MSRTPLLLLIISIAGFQGAGNVVAAPPSAPSTLALAANDQEKEITKYNRKLEKIAAKRAKGHQKLEAELWKLQRKKGMDLRKLQKKLDELRRNRDKLEEKYRKELLKLEREWQQKHDADG